MKSVRQGLNDDEIEKDTYERLQCTACGTSLKRREDQEEGGRVKYCPKCEREWRDR